MRTEAAWWLGPMLVRGRPYPMVVERACAVREHVSCTHTAAVAKVERVVAAAAEEVAKVERMVAAAAAWWRRWKGWWRRRRR